MTGVLDALFRPRSVAVIGASTDPRKLGGRLFGQNRLLGFAGALYPVNPSAEQVQGLPAYASIEAVPGAVDCAIIAVPAAAVPAALAACGRKQVPLAVLFSSGFAEHDAAGAIAQAALLAQARRDGIRLLGPNSMGALSLFGRFSATFSAIDGHPDETGAPRGWPPIGGVAIASQSGAVGTQILLAMRERGVGVAHWVATGNQCDLDVADAIAWFASDDATRIVAVYLEGVADGARLRAALAACRRVGKPVVVLKVGRSEAGAQAAASHTAALAGSDAVYDAVFAAAGAWRAPSLEGLVDVVAILAANPLAAASSAGTLGIVTNSGGIGVLMADEASAHELVLPILSAPARDAIRALSPLAAPGNPVDVGAAGMNDMGLLVRCAEIVLEQSDCASLAVFLSHLGLMPARMAQAEPLLHDLRARFADRVLALVVNTDPARAASLQQAGLCVFTDPSRAVAAIAARCWLAAPPVPDPVPALLPTILPALAEGAGGELAARRLLRAIGLKVVDEILATTPGAAADAARRFAGPVVVKIAADIAHKSDIGGVCLDLAPDAVEAAVTRMLAQVAIAVPGTRLDGVLVSPMISGGIELILGVRRDPVFGAMLLVGFGGIFAELLSDVVIRPAPVDAAGATAMLRALRGWKLLAGSRGRPAGDVPALARAMALLSAYAAHCADELESLEINPLLVLPPGQGVLALDALVVTRAGA